MSTSGGGGPGAKKPPPRGAWGTASPSPSMASPSLPNGTPAGAPNAWKIPAAATTTTAAAAPSAPNGVGKAGGGVDEKTMMTAMHDRMVWLMTNFIVRLDPSLEDVKLRNLAQGSKLVVHLKSGPPLTGILSSAGTDSELCLTLSRAYPVPSLTPSSSTRPATPPPPSHPDDVKHSIIILGNELVDVEVHAVDWDERARSDASFMGSSSTNNGSSSNRFRTDAETTGQAGSVREKELQAWTGGADVSGGIEDGPDDLAATLFPSDGRPSRGGPSSTRTLSKPWDQFEQNEKLFGLKTDFDEEIYTTKLDRSGKDYKERERQADRLAREILTGTAGKDVGAHVREERGFVDDSGTNEEDKWVSSASGSASFADVRQVRRRRARRGSLRPTGRAKRRRLRSPVRSETPAGRAEAVPVRRGRSGIRVGYPHRPGHLHPSRYLRIYRCPCRQHPHSRRQPRCEQQQGQRGRRTVPDIRLRRKGKGAAAEAGLPQVGPRQALRRLQGVL